MSSPGAHLLCSGLKPYPLSLGWGPLVSVCPLDSSPCGLRPWILERNVLRAGNPGLRTLQDPEKSLAWGLSLPSAGRVYGRLSCL